MWAPATAKATATAGSELLTAFADGSDPRILSGSGTATVSLANAQSLLDNSIAGPALTAYTAAGAPVSVQTRWAKVQNADAGAGKSDVWNLYYADKGSVANGSTSWTNAGQAFTFNTSGQLTAPTGTAVAIPNLTIDGNTLGTVSLSFGSGGLTEYASVQGGITTNALQQDGYASGTLTDVQVTEDGRIVGTYSNGATPVLARIGVVQFANDDGLKADTHGNYRQTADSGAPLSGLNGSTLVGGNVETSNTDIASEFSKMIVTQQAYSANTRVLSTAQTMMSDLINIIR